MSSQHPLEPAALYRMIPGYRGEFTVASGLLRRRCQRQRLGGFETALRAQKISGLDERVANRIEPGHCLHARERLQRIVRKIAARNPVPGDSGQGRGPRSEEHTSELQSLMRISYAVFGLKKKTKK